MALSRGCVRVGLNPAGGKGYSCIMQLLSGATKGERAGECAREVFEAVPPVIWFIRGHMAKHRAGLSLPQCRVLCLLDHQPDASLSTIADFIGASLPTASRMVSGLVEEGWVS